MSNISVNVKKHIHQLEFIGSIKNKKLRKQLFEYIATQPRLYSALQEIAYNVMQNRINIPKNILTKLRSNKRSLVELISPTKKTKRKKIVVQSGGSLSLVFPLLMSLISALK